MTRLRTGTDVQPANPMDVATRFAAATDPDAPHAFLTDNRPARRNGLADGGRRPAHRVA
jgi:hypothetical protein